ncbi:MAG: type II toxin-antitoxin system VapC family toxin [Anaerolineae bacterium]
MKLLLDTNLPLEVLLRQERGAEARQVLANRAGHELYLSVFSLHSMGVTLLRRGLHAAFTEFVADMIDSGRVTVLTLPPSAMHRLSSTAVALSLDFDDAYQYVAAEQHGLDIVSYDAHFDLTPRGRLTPAQVLAERGSQ